MTGELLVSTVVPGGPATPGVDGPAATARFNNPSFLGYQPSGNLVIVENSAIRILNTTGFVTTLTGNPSVPGLTDGAKPNVGIRDVTGMTVAPISGDVYFTYSSPQQDEVSPCSSLVS